jgi:hypothetical protein
MSNHCNPINPGSDKIMIIAYGNFPSVGNCFLSSLYYEADKKIMSNHCNPINPGSDKIMIIAYRNFPGVGGLLSLPNTETNKKIMAIIVIPLIPVQTK